jgi:excisionase family DNA binding protein
MKTVNDEPERLVLTVEEAAKILGISRGTAYVLANNGGIPAIRISRRRIIVPRKALEDFLASADKTKGMRTESEENDARYWSH